MIQKIFDLHMILLRRIRLKKSIRASIASEVQDDNGQLTEQIAVQYWREKDGDVNRARSYSEYESIITLGKLLMPYRDKESHS